jgi:hypothetical protein
MKRFGFLLVALCILGAGCDDDDSPASPSGQPLVFSALLSPANEVPAITNAESSGRGAVQITITPTRNSSGTITAATVDFYIQLIDFPGGTRMQAAHIHAGGAGVNGPVRIDTGTTPATARDAGGTVEINIQDMPADPAIVQQIIDNPAAWYFNVHSPVNPGGFARGQLAHVQ